MMTRRTKRSPRAPSRPDEGDTRAEGWGGLLDGVKRAGVGVLAAGLFLVAGGAAGGDVSAAFADVGGVEPTSSVTVQDLQRYDGFEDYAAQGQQMENSDVGCFANECKRETSSCFTDGSCLKVCVESVSCCSAGGGPLARKEKLKKPYKNDVSRARYPFNPKSSAELPPTAVQRSAIFLAADASGMPCELFCDDG